MIALLPNSDVIRCIDCAVSWTGGPLDPCWSCGNTGVTPMTDPAAMVKVYWPTMSSAYTERPPGGPDVRG